MQGELGATARYTGALHAVATIARQEGLSALFKGIKPALLRQSTYGGMRVGFYEPIKAKLCQWGAVKDTGNRACHTAASVFAFVPGRSSALNPTLPPSAAPLFVKAGAGIFAGALASAICTPTDVIKVRLQADVTAGGVAPRYRGLLDAVRHIWRHEGFSGLYKGVTPTTQRAAVVAMAELATYDESKQLLVNVLGQDPQSLKTHVASAIMAGFMATLASSPLDVVKSRLMNQPVGADGKGLRYSSSLDCFRKTVAIEGFHGLYKGFWPNFARIGPHVVITFIVVGACTVLCLRRCLRTAHFPRCRRETARLC